MRMPRAAFTLVEIVLVIIIMAVVMAMTLPNFSTVYHSQELKEIAQDLQDKARWAQVMAMGRRRIYALSFTFQPDSYRVVSAPMDSDQPVFSAVAGSAGRAHVLPNGVRLSASKDRIEFFPDATIDSASIELQAHGKKVTLSSMAKAGVFQVVNDR